MSIVRIAVLGALLACLAAAPAAAQEAGHAELEQARRALAAGDARLLMDGAAERLELSVLAPSALYTRSQAMYVLQKFFEQHPPRRCVLQNVSQAEGSWFAAALYWHARAEQPYQVYLRLRQRGPTWELREVRIERSLRE